MFQVYDSEYLANLLGITAREFHRKIKPMIRKDFESELNELGVENPDIGLDSEKLIYLVDPRDHSVYYETRLSISAYI
jgi:hypothetical protein